jgi:uncharacterized protein
MDPHTQTLLSRIADALDRIAPPTTKSSDALGPVFTWDGSVLNVATHFHPVDVDLLTGIDAQKHAVMENSSRLAEGHGAHDILLWGARGSGKSALVKATTAALQSRGSPLHLVEVAGNRLDSLPSLFALLANAPHPTIVFIDDLGFDQNGEAARHLRSVLDGGVAARPPHVRLYMTSNRRHIVARDISEQASAINPRDVVDDHLALADRFGLSLGFHTCDQDTYLAMVRGYAAHLGVVFDPADALLWSTQRGARSGRVAWHYAVELAGRAGKSA